MKVLVIPSDNTLGTDWYRATGVFNRLPIQMVKPDGKQFSWTTLADIDVFFLQRPATQSEVHYLEIAKKYKKKILLDYDDDPTCLNPENPVYELWNRDDKQACVKAALKLADIVMVSTPALKESLQSIVPTADIRVVPNAQDDKLFSFEPFHGERNKIIAMRGGGSHKIDWGIYSDAILQILREHPDYKLAAMGYHPDWMRDIPDNQLMLHEFRDIPTYFENLMLLRPQIAIVPLADNKFNRCKSNIGWQEFTMAGAHVFASDLPEFRVNGCATFSTPEELVRKVNDSINGGVINELVYQVALQNVPRLSDINELRRDILEELMESTEKYSPKSLPKRVATDEEFHEHSLSHGNTSDDPDYKKLHSRVAEWIIKTLNPKHAVELGCGTGGTLYELLIRGVHTYGIEINPLSYKDFINNHPMFENQIFLSDFTKEPIQTDEVCDLVYSFEVFEHINMPEEWWVEFLTDLSKKFKYFYFSSTPYYENENWDYFWGHKNLRKTSSWIKLFEQSGWKFLTNPRVLVNWDVLFKSTSY